MTEEKLGLGSGPGFWLGWQGTKYWVPGCLVRRTGDFGWGEGGRGDEARQRSTAQSTEHGSRRVLLVTRYMYLRHDWPDAFFSGSYGGKGK